MLFSEYFKQLPTFNSAIDCVTRSFKYLHNQDYDITQKDILIMLQAFLHMFNIENYRPRLIFFCNPSTKHLEQLELTIKVNKFPKYKGIISVEPEKEFYQNVLHSVSKWVLLMHNLKGLYQNLTELNKIMQDFTTDTAFSINFAIGKGILGLTDKHVTLGINAEVLQNLDEVAFLQSELTSIEAKNQLKESMKVCITPCDILHQHISIIDQLQLHTNKTTKVLLRQWCTRYVKFTRYGVCYASTPDYFTVVEKRKITLGQAMQLQAQGKYVIFNKAVSKTDLRKALTYIHISYRVPPMTKDGVLLDIDIRDIPDIITANEVKI